MASRTLVLSLRYTSDSRALPACVLPVLVRSCIHRDQFTEEDAVWVLNKVELLEE